MVINIPFIAMAEHGIIHEACVSLGLKHRLHSSYEKSIVERTIEHFKDRTEIFDDYFPCMASGLCNLQHVHKWKSFCVYA
jgi:putative transposase